MEFKVTVLPDDPRLSKAAARKRALKPRGYRNSRFKPGRSLEKAHQHHLITDVPTFPIGWEGAKS